MSAVSRRSLKRAVVALGLVSCITAALAASTSPGSVGIEQRMFTTVDRANKSDRLPSATLTLTFGNRLLSNPLARASQKGPPSGCDPAFSVFANPERASIYKRCIT
jgi:hypothetical protein